VAEILPEPSPELAVEDARVMNLQNKELHFRVSICFSAQFHQEANSLHMLFCPVPSRSQRRNDAHQHFNQHYNFYPTNINELREFKDVKEKKNHIVFSLERSELRRWAGLQQDLLLQPERERGRERKRARGERWFFFFLLADGRIDFNPVFFISFDCVQ
jgi:hypothetical protein